MYPATKFDYYVPNLGFIATRSPFHQCLYRALVVEFDNSHDEDLEVWGLYQSWLNERLPFITVIGFHDVVIQFDCESDTTSICTLSLYMEDGTHVETKLTMVDGVLTETTVALVEPADGYGVTSRYMTGDTFEDCVIQAFGLTQ